MTGVRWQLATLLLVGGVVTACGKPTVVGLCGDLATIPFRATLDVGERTLDVEPGPGAEDCLDPGSGTAVTVRDALVTANLRIESEAVPAGLLASIRFFSDDDANPFREPRVASALSALEPIGRRAFVIHPEDSTTSGTGELSFLIPDETPDDYRIFIVGEFVRAGDVAVLVEAEELLAGTEEGEINSRGWRWNRNVSGYHARGYLVSVEEDARPISIEVEIPAPGRYGVWVRDYGFGSGGATRLEIDGVLLTEQGGESRSAFAWESVGVVDLEAGLVELTFHDFETGLSATDQVLLAPEDADDPNAWAPDGYLVLDPANARSMVRDFYAEALSDAPPPTDLTEWEAERASGVETVRAALSLDAMPSLPAPDPIFVDELVFADYRIEKLLFPDLMGMEVPGALYLPMDLSSPVPVIVNPIGHWGDGMALEHVQARCITFARLGMAAMTIDWPDYGQRRFDSNDNDHFFGFHSLLLGDETARIYLGEWIRILDYLETRAEIDMSRVGVTGASGGGWASLYLAIVDARIAATAPVSEVATWEQLELVAVAGDPEQHPPGLGLMPFGWLLALVAPRPMFVANGISEGLFPASSASGVVDWAAEAYALYGAEDALSFLASPGGHGYYLDRREAVAEFFAAEFLGLPGPVSEVGINLLSSQDFAVGLDPDGPTIASLNRAAVAAMPPLPDSMSATDVAAWQGSAGAALTAVLEPAAPAPIDATTISTGLDGERIAIVTEVGLEMPAVLWTPVDADPPWSAVVYYAEPGKTAAIYVPDLQAVGLAVLVVEPHQSGETLEPRLEKAELHRTLHTPIVLGRSVMGIRARDLTTAVAYLDSLPEIGSVGVLGHGESAGPIALAAAALDDRIAAAAAVRPLLSLRSTFDMPDLPPGALITYGILTVADVPHLAALIAPRPVTVIGAVDAAHAERDVDLTATYEFAREVFDVLGATESLTVRGVGEADGPALAAFFADAL